MQFTVNGPAFQQFLGPYVTSIRYDTHQPYCAYTKVDERKILQGDQMTMSPGRGQFYVLEC